MIEKGFPTVLSRQDLIFVLEQFAILFSCVNYNILFESLHILRSHAISFAFLFSVYSGWMKQN